MRLGGAGFLAATLALAGCKGTGTKPPDKEPVGTAASRTRGKGPEWLDEMAKRPGAGTAVPKADSWADANDPKFNAAREVRGVLGGRVVDVYGRGAKDVFVRVELADGTAAERGKGGAPVGIMTDANGHFLVKSLLPGRAYNLMAEAQLDGKPIYGVVQTRTPNTTISIELRDDQPLPPPAGGEGGAAPRPGPPSVGPDGLPPPADLNPASGTAPPASRTRTPGTDWSPDGVPAMRPVPSSLDPIPVQKLPAPTDPTPKTNRPESTADGPKDPWKPPTTNIPAPVPVPKLPGNTGPQSRLVPPGANFALRDSSGRPWEFASSTSAKLVVLDFMTTTCVPCKKAIPILRNLQADYATAGLEVIGVVCDERPLGERVALAAKYSRDHDVNYGIYTPDAAEPTQLLGRFGGAAYPFVVLLDSSGRVLWKGNPLAGQSQLEAAVRANIGK